MAKKILILGGTAEARALAERLAGRGDLDVTLSLAGRTAAPARHAVPIRRGGFGGAVGLTDYLQRERIDALIDATHPFASVISANAVAAARQANVPFVGLRRAPWTAMAGDHWSEVSDVSVAIETLGQTGRRVFVTLGRSGLAPLQSAPQHHYLIRSVDPVDPPLALPHAHYIIGRGPFAAADERALMTTHRIDIVVAKNSGGAATYGKIEAARALGLVVIMLRRPPPPDGPAAHSVDEALAWLDHVLTSTADAARGV